ncbi:methionyl-tRNA formyltransferase [Candidatus Bipolaricaulota bacterium]|nr:methionyl-tRNA formyltransferase [Candidatus Bipolaricaulota bacterium]HBR10452.1 methionyl-tRNA formyltransferase [Candidatus Acetothermia bacterium]
MKIVFIGTGGFALPALRALASRNEIILVVTQPDRPAGRDRKISEPPVKRASKALGLPVIQPVKIQAEQGIEPLIDASPDVIVVAAYGQILPRAVIELPLQGTINIHASLLPQYRGAAPINWVLINGEEKTGVTTFFLDEGIDTGPILLQCELTIDPDETAEELQIRLAEQGAQLIVETIDRLTHCDLTAIPQDNSAASYAPKLSRADGKIDWNRPSTAIYNQARGMTPWPGTFTYLNGKRIKIHRCRLSGINSHDFLPGKIVLPETGRLLIATADDLLEIVEIQPAGRRAMSGRAFLCGLHKSDGDLFQ